MSGQLAADEPYTTQFSTTVRAVDGRDVRLETTYFYPEGGGQPADVGRIATASVEDVRLVDGEVVHRLAEEPRFDAGRSALCTVDWERRMYCMRAHTAGHAMYGAARTLFDELSYGGFDIAAPDGSPGGDEKVRIDFRTGEPIDDEALVELERRVNRVVWEARDVTWTERPAEEALGDEAIAFNAETEAAVADGDTVRVVTIEDWDAAACGGTHVRNTREIGPVTVLGRSNPGEGLTRVEFAVGPAGIERRAEEKAAALAAGRELDAGVADLADAAERLRTERDDLEAERDALRAALVDARIEQLRADAVERDGATWIAGTIDRAAPSDGDVADRLRALAGEAADVVALVGTERPPSVAVAAADGIDASAVVESLTDAFGGGGGGSPAFAQAGGLDARPEAVVEALRSGDA